MSEGRVPTALKRQVAERARYCCEYCRSQARVATTAFSVEHVVPKVRGGNTDLENLALACQGCNNHKFDKVEARDPISGLMAALYHPRRDVWRTHFAWNDDFTLLVGLTPTGRATIDALRLNWSGVVSLRRILFVMGEHPRKSSTCELPSPRRSTHLVASRVAPRAFRPGGAR
jgi:HNH endonuclease